MMPEIEAIINPGMADKPISAQVRAAVNSFSAPTRSVANAAAKFPQSREFFEKEQGISMPPCSSFVPSQIGGQWRRSRPLGQKSLGKSSCLFDDLVGAGE